MLYGLSADTMKTGFQININVNLIKITEVIEDESIEISCFLLKDVSPFEGWTF